MIRLSCEFIAILRGWILALPFRDLLICLEDETADMCAGHACYRGEDRRHGIRSIL